MNYYNENDPKAVAWLRELIAQGHIPAGVVDDRSIKDIKPHELEGFIQCHFFAGIGGWSLALALAGWPASRPVWTGSCPCQPFSSAGKGEGILDPRHLWPFFRELIRERCPAVVFGEQVASKAGREWLSGVFLDLEGMAYRRAGADLCAAGKRAPHIRQRLWWVADADFVGRERISRRGQDGAAKRGGPRRLAHSEDTDRRSEQQPGEPWRRRSRSSGSGEAFALGMGQPLFPGLEGFAGTGHGGNQPGRLDAHAPGSVAEAGLAGHWDAFELIPCRDGKARRIEPGTFPLAHGIPARMGRLRGYGNAIVPQVAAEFIKAYLEVA